MPVEQSNKKATAVESSMDGHLDTKLLLMAPWITSSSPSHRKY